MIRRTAKKQFGFLGYAFGGAFLLSGCVSMKVPDFDFIKLPEFREDAENIGDYPKVADGPKNPVGVRTAAQWDRAAFNLIAKGESVAAPYYGETQLTDAEIFAKMVKLSARIDEYKLDDPQ